MNMSTNFNDIRTYFKLMKKSDSKLKIFDLHNAMIVENSLMQNEIEKVENIKKCEVDFDNFSLKPSNEWKVYKFNSMIAARGLLVIINAFTAKCQQYFIRKCLIDYTKKPHMNNLFKTISNWNGDISWWTYCQEKKLDIKTFNKLRWVTLGYQHNWDTKVYSENAKSSIPYELSQLSSCLTSSLGFSFCCEAIIINYYPPGSFLGPHVDNSEHNMTSPLVSVSFGQDAIFLIGGQNLDVKPIALRLHSGDVLLMSEESRFSYHAVPKIIINSANTWFDSSDENQLEEKVKEYLSQSRINISMRQVL